MVLILATAFIAVAALALANPNNPLQPRVLPQALGSEQGWDFLDQLTFTIYKDKGCQDLIGVYTGQYGYYVAFQMNSYRLSRPLEENEVLDFYSGLATSKVVNNTFDSTLDGHYTEACWLYDVTAGVNATSHDDGHDEDKDGRQKGCHKLNKNEWCAIVWQK